MWNFEKVSQHFICDCLSAELISEQLMHCEACPAPRVFVMLPVPSPCIVCSVTCVLTLQLIFAVLAPGQHADSWSSAHTISRQSSLRLHVFTTHLAREYSPRYRYSHVQADVLSRTYVCFILSQGKSRCLISELHFSN